MNSGGSASQECTIGATLGTNWQRQSARTDVPMNCAMRSRPSAWCRKRFRFCTRFMLPWYPVPNLLLATPCAWHHWAAASSLSCRRPPSRAVGLSAELHIGMMLFGRWGCERNERNITSSCKPSMNTPRRDGSALSSNATKSTTSGAGISQMPVRTTAP